MNSSLSRMLTVVFFGLFLSFLALSPPAAAENTPTADEPRFVHEWGTKGTGPGEFHSPICIAISRKDEIFVADLNNSRIQQFKAKEPGAFGEYTFGNLKNTFGPIGVMADGLDRIWVSSLNDRVQCFTPEGKFLFRLDGTSDEDLFAKPHGMAVDSKGFLYIADAGNQRIVKFALPLR